MSVEAHVQLIVRLTELIRHWREDPSPPNTYDGLFWAADELEDLIDPK